MKGKELKAYMLAAFFACVAILGLGYTAATVFTDLQTIGDMIVGDDLTVADDLSVTGDSDIAGGLSLEYLVLNDIVDVAVTTPTIVGQLIVNSSYELYISTDITTIECWVKVGTQS